MCREYASLVSTRVRELGLAVQTQQLSPTVSLADALDSAAQQGLLYAAIITSQHEMHRSVTLTILHGRNPQGRHTHTHTHTYNVSSPTSTHSHSHILPHIYTDTLTHPPTHTEHKNMPLEDALSLVSKDFEHYVVSGRPTAAQRKPASHLPHLLGKAASGGSLSSSELSAVISALQKQKQEEEIVPSHHST